MAALASVETQGKVRLTTYHAFYKVVNFQGQQLWKIWNHISAHQTTTHYCIKKPKLDLQERPDAEGSGGQHIAVCDMPPSILEKRVRIMIISLDPPVICITKMNASK
jgi:hypothetical protein